MWDPQVWPKVIDRWETNAVRAWQNRTHSDDMWELLETLLRETIGNWYNTYKKDFAKKVSETKVLGNNPYNFTSLIREICIGVDPTIGNTSIQDITLGDLDQIQFSSWKYLREFSNNYALTASKNGKLFDEKIRDKYFRKLL